MGGFLGGVGGCVSRHFFGQGVTEGSGSLCFCSQLVLLRISFPCNMNVVLLMNDYQY